ncbi:MAG: hypothetical protein KIS78_02370 [Labilithrix sp.]|nr:hypothetical protein [Labilithrix sp.]
MKHHRERVFAAVVAVVVLLVTDRAAADPVNLGDPADPSSAAATGTFAEGKSASAAPDPVTGIMRYAYPFELPAARGSAQPRLALRYSSSSGDGEAGYGWSLDLPSIERRPLSGNPRFESPASHQATSDERFFFEGQPLVRVCTVPACPSGETHPAWATGWRYFRLQVEGLFARFYLSGDKKQWRVQTKGGERMDFGSVDGSSEAIEFIGDDSKIVRWRLVRHMDALHLDGGGAPLNYVLYRWQKLGARGLAYLTDVFDTPRASGHASDLDFAHHTQLDWDWPDYPQTAYTDPLHARPDMRLARIGVSSKTWYASSAREVIRIYKLAYAATRAPLVAYDPATMAPLWHHSFLRSITIEGKCGAVENGAGEIPLTVSCRDLPPTTFHYEAGPIGVPGVVATVSNIQGGAPDLVSNRRVLFDVDSANVVDFNRDGMPDVVQSWESGPNCGGYDNAYTHIVRPQPPAAFTGIDDVSCTRYVPGTSNPIPLGVVGSSRLMVGYMNRGTDGVLFSHIDFAHQCMDGGSDVGEEYGNGTSPASRNAGVYPTPYASAFFTAQGGATVAGAWSTGVVTWAPKSIPGFTPRAYFAEPIHGGFGGTGCDPENFEAIGFHPAWRWRPVDGLDWVDEGQASAGQTNWYTDVDGDGLVDQIVEAGQPPSGELKAGLVHFTRRTAANEAGAAPATQKPFYFESTTAGSSLVPAPEKPDHRYFYVDVDGDGLVDLVVWNGAVAGSPPRVRLGDGRGGFRCETGKQPWGCLPAGADPTAGYDVVFLGAPAPTLPAEIQFRDVTGDGLADLVQYDSASGASQGNISLWVNVDGQRFACASPATDCVVGRVFDDVHGTADIGRHRMTFADMNADGVDDLVVLAGVGVFVAPMLGQTAPASLGEGAPRPGLLTRIDNGYGATTKIDYKSVQHLDVEAAGTTLQWTHHSRAVESVVTKITTLDTSSADGVPLADPYRFRRTISYGYLDPAYDRWTRTFSGFRKVAVNVGDESAVTLTTNWFGACQNDTFYNVPGDSTDVAGHRCAYTSDDDPAKARTGRPVRVDRFIPGVPGPQGAPEKWLWSRTYRWTDAPPPIVAEERSVHFAYLGEVETTIYDDAIPVQPGVLTPGSNGDDPVESSPTQAGSKRLLRRTGYDRNGNLVRVEDEGLVDEADTATVIVYSQADPGAEPPNDPVPLACSDRWVCNPTYVTVFGRPAGAPAAYARERHVRLTYELPQNSGGVSETAAFVALGSPALVRQAPAPYPPGASGGGWRVLATAAYDAIGNVTQSVAGPSSAAPECKTFLYDEPYQHLPAGVQEHWDGCGSASLNTATIFDRGFGRVVAVVEPTMAMTSFALDRFGRTEQVYYPDRDGPTGFTSLGVATTYHDVAPLPFVDVSVLSSPTDAIRSITVMNGLGERVLRFDQGDASAPWILQPFVVRDGTGRPILHRRASAFTGDPVTYAENATPPPMAAEYVFHALDGFGRRYLTTEVPSGLKYETRDFHPLVVETRDAEQSKAGGPHAAAFTRVELDGHGRTRRTVQRVGGQDIHTVVTYRPTGEPGLVRRASGAGNYERTFVYDELGRLRANDEPNTGEWRYAWDDAGRLVGTSDARGCGKNLHYDGLGRVVGEDYAPCLPSHPAYSEPVPATGEGFEVFNRYDLYEPGQIGSDPDFVETTRLAMGRLASRRDRGSHTRFNYDARGDARRISRRVAKPVGTVSPDPYVPDWLAQRNDFDAIGRPTRRTAGIGIGQLGEGQESYAYSTRGLLQSIGSTYGALVSSITYEPDGAVRRIVYGDAAATEALFTYGTTYGTRRLERYEVTRSPPAGGLWTTSAPGYPIPDWQTTQTQLARFEYEYDAVGNPTVIHDHVAASQYPDEPGFLPIRTRTSEFDDLYRLRDVRYDYATSDGVADWRGGPYRPEVDAYDTRHVPLLEIHTRISVQTFAYDFLGNVTASADDANAYYDRSLGTVTHGSPTNGPNQIRSADGITATHDVSGNLVELKVSRLGICPSGGVSRCAQWFAYDWDEVGQLVRARRWDFESALPVLPPGELPSTTPSWTLTYAYSGGVRVLKSDNDGTVDRHTVDVFDTARFVRVPFDDVMGTYDVGPGEKEAYFAGGMARVFEDRSQTLPLAPGHDETHVFLRIADHLGSSTAVIERATGELVSRSSTQAYGAIESDFRPSRWGAARDPYKLTGKEEDIEVGLVYFGARYYQPHLGRWASPDPLTIHALGSDLNPYAYVGGRVMNHVDPFGLCSAGDSSDCIGGAYWPDAAGNQPAGSSMAYDDRTPNNGGGLVGNMYRDWVAAGRPNSGGVHGDGHRGAELAGPFWDLPRDPILHYGTQDHGASSAGGIPSTSYHGIEFLPRATLDAARYPNLAALAAARDREDFVLYTAAPLALTVLTAGAGATLAAQGTINNPIPRTLTRVIGGDLSVPTLGRPGAADVFVTAAEDIAGMNPAQIAERLTIPKSSTFTVYTFAAPAEGLASPILRSDPGFVGRGLTAGGAREYVLPNGPIPVGAVRTVVR